MYYRQALNYLDGLVNYEAQPRAGAVTGLSLAKMQKLSAYLDDPHESYPSIHITGTNGKGSTATMIEALLTSMGLRVGTYCSPHISSPTERIRLVGEQIDEATFAELIGQIAALVQETEFEPLTWFETITAAAFLHFANEAVHAAVVEVGMLGTFDATNIIDASVAVITNISRDHTDGKPGWWYRIAEEKSGIVKEGATAILGESTPELTEVVTARSPKSISVPQVLSNEVALGGRLITVKTPRGLYDQVFVGLHGRHQGHNCALAIAAVEEFFDAPLDASVTEEALHQLTLRGRLEVGARSPLVLLDAAHNQGGATALAQALAEEFGVFEQRFLVFGMQDGRDPREVLAALDLVTFDFVVACTAPTPRGLDAAIIAAEAQSLGANVYIICDVGAAVEFALGQATSEDQIVVAGSVTVLEIAREALKQ